MISFLMFILTTMVLYILRGLVNSWASRVLKTRSNYSYGHTQYVIKEMLKLTTKKKKMGKWKLPDE